MDPFDISNPDDLLKGLLRWAFGPSAAITITFIVINAAWSWYGTFEDVKSGVKFARRTYSAASARLRRMPKTAIVLGTAVSAVLLVLQAIWIWISFVAGNAISYLFTGDVPRDGPKWGTVLESLHWDTITAAYVAASVAALAASYVLASRGIETTKLGLIIAAPAILWLIPTALLSALALVVATLYWLSDHVFRLDPAGESAMLVVALSTAHILACTSAMRTSRLMVRIWKGPVNARRETTYPS
ncbi:hypothetical protein [Amycolatopsis kentuckyensis]|uniref:hypothetical protein n=1 Tax=Amycolatopsis kentuckyensis TaxID=218823 RepID=UPI000A3758D9|nr:hypothetical protein [Amycolatopsis kentuckyensis]